MLSCCVKSCPSQAGCKGVLYFRFPAIRTNPELRQVSIDRRKAWIEAIGGFRKGLTADSALVCARHFVSGRPASIEDSEHPDWVPTLGLWEEVEELAGGANAAQMEEEEVNPAPITHVVTVDSSKICRLCLGKEVKLTKPFQEGTRTNSALLQKIYECTTVKITLKTTYPAAICAICDTKLTEYSKFREKCIENDGILRMLLDDVGGGGDEDESEDNKLIEPIDYRETDEYRDLQQQQLYGSSDEATVSQSEFAGSDEQATTSSSSATEAASSPATVPRISVIAAKNLLEQKVPVKVANAIQTKPPTAKPTISVKPISSLASAPVAAASTSTETRKIVTVESTVTSGLKDGLQAVVGPDGRLECVICSRPFRNTYTLRRHMNLHTEENLFTCEYCGKKFNDRSNWKIHLRAHTGDNLLRCAVCFKTFISPSTLKYHLRAHRKLKIFECRLCAETAETYDILATHVNEKHGDVQLDDLTKNNTDDSFIAGDFLKIEMEADETTLMPTMHGPPDDCDMEPIPDPPPLIPAPTINAVAAAPPTASLPGNVQIKEEVLDDDHIEIKQEPIDDGTLQSDPDGGIAQQPLASLNPTAEEDAPPVILFRCDYCMKIFKYLYELRVHMKLHNNGKQQTAATSPGSKDAAASGAPKTTLVLAPNIGGPPAPKRPRHPSIDEDVGELANAPLPEHKCDKCEKCFRTEELLKVHIETHATDEDVTQARSCKVCFKTFKCELNLVSHIKKHHLYAAYVNEQQQQHQQLDDSSEDIKPPSPDSSSNDGFGSLEAEGSSGEGAASSALGQTERRCEICALTFSCSYKLEKHVLTHFKNNEAVAFVPSADRPYKCTECHKRFKRKDYLLIHIRTHTGERRHKCDMCSSAFVHPSNLITHRKLHSNERPFKCDLCPAAFKLYAGLKIHRKRCALKYLQENSVTIT